MDWDAKITEICEELEIDPMIFNDNETTQEVISKRLGFPSFASFIAFPDPVAIVDGRGGPLRPEHLMLSLHLGSACVEEILRQYNVSMNEDDFYRQVNRFFKYVSENFVLEIGVGTLSSAVRSFRDQIEDFDLDNVPVWKNEIVDKYKGFMSFIK